MGFIAKNTKMAFPDSLPDKNSAKNFQMHEQKYPSLIE